MSLPIFNTPDKNILLLQTTWSSQLNPLINAPLAGSILLQEVVLTTGLNTVSHMLDRSLEGWIVTRQRGNALIYDLQDTNKIPNKTLVLMSSSGVSIDLLVF